MNKEIMARARGSWWEALGFKSKEGVARGASPGVASKRSSRNSQARATPPKPSALPRRNARRVQGAGGNGSIHIQKLVGAQKGLAQIRQRLGFWRSAGFLDRFAGGGLGVDGLGLPFEECSAPVTLG